MIRNVLATKLCDMPRPETSEKLPQPRNSMRHVFALVGIWVVFRMFSSGGFKILARGLSALAFGEDITPRAISNDAFDEFDEF